MNYELAKQLKDAGWSQDNLGRKISIRSNEAVVPTLEELIEACGEEFWILRKANGGGWVATNGKLGGDEIKTDIFDSRVEAVARLWLALKTKSL